MALNCMNLLNNSKYFSRNGGGIDTTFWEINNYQVTPLMNNLMIMNETKSLFNTEYELCKTPFHFQNEFFVNGLDISINDDELKNIADLIAGKGFDIGSLVAPVWPGTIGDSAMGDAEQRGKFLDAVKMACRIGKIFNEHGARKYGVIRIDSAEFGIEKS